MTFSACDFLLRLLVADCHICSFQLVNIFEACLVNDSFVNDSYGPGLCVQGTQELVMLRVGASLLTAGLSHRLDGKVWKASVRCQLQLACFCLVPW